MGKIYIYLGYSFVIYSDDHLPIHCHVKMGEFECKVELIYDNGKLIDILIKRVSGKKMMPTEHHSEIKRFCKKYQKQIAEKWMEIMALRKTPKCEVITKKI